MKPLDLLKNLPTPARMLFRPMLLISLVLHGVVLMLPLPADQQKLKPSKKEETVKITKLPPGSKSSSRTSGQSSTNSTLQLTPQKRQVNLRPSPQQRQTNSPQITVTRPLQQTNSPQITVTRPLQQTNSPRNQPINKQSVSSDTSKTKLEENPATSQASNQESQESLASNQRLQDSNQRSQDSNQRSQDSNQRSQDSNQESQDSNQRLQDSNQESQDSNQRSQDSNQRSQDSNQRSQDSNQESQDSAQGSQDSAQGSTPAQKIINFFSTFPRYPGAAKSSGGVLRPEFDKATYIFHTQDNLETVASKFEKELLPTQNFTSPKLSRNEANFKVYEVSNFTGSETNYLYLISQNGKTAIYLEAENYTLAQLIKGETEDRNDQLLGGYIIAGIEGIKPQYNLKKFEPANDFDRLDEKDRFKDKNFDFEHARKTTADNPVSEEKLISSLEAQLKVFNFEPLSKEPNYGKSAVYRVKQGTSETYLVLAPAKDDQGKPITVILLSKNKPS